MPGAGVLESSVAKKSKMPKVRCDVCKRWKHEHEQIYVVEFDMYVCSEICWNLFTKQEDVGK